MLDSNQTYEYYCHQCKRTVEEKEVKVEDSGSLMHKNCKKIVTVLNKKPNIITK